MGKTLKISTFLIALFFANNALSEWFVDNEIIAKQAIPDLDSLLSHNSVDELSDETYSASFIGGYRQSKYFSLQLEYQQELSFGVDNMFTGSSLWFPEAESTNLESNAIFLSGVSSYPINDNSSVYLKGGLFNWEVRSDQLNLTDESFEDNGTDMFFGFGANYGLSTRFEVSAEWERYQLDEDVDILSTELKFKF